MVRYCMSKTNIKLIAFILLGVAVIGIILSKMGIDSYISVSRFWPSRTIDSKYNLEAFQYPGGDWKKITDDLDKAVPLKSDPSGTNLGYNIDDIGLLVNYIKNHPQKTVLTKYTYRELITIAKQAKVDQDKKERPRNFMQLAQAPASSKVDSVSLAMGKKQIESTAPPKSQNKEWYDGQVLNAVPPRIWNSSSYDSKLASAANYIARLSTKGGLKISVNSMNEWKPYAIELEKCISTALYDLNEPVYENQTSNEAASFCMLSMGWTR